MDRLQLYTLQVTSPHRTFLAALILASQGLCYSNSEYHGTTLWNWMLQMCLAPASESFSGSRLPLISSVSVVNHEHKGIHLVSSVDLMSTSLNALNLDTSCTMLRRQRTAFKLWDHHLSSSPSGVAMPGDQLNQLLYEDWTYVIFVAARTYVHQESGQSLKSDLTPQAHLRRLGDKLQPASSSTERHRNQHLSATLPTTVIQLRHPQPLNIQVVPTPCPTQTTSCGFYLKSNHLFYLNMGQISHNSCSRSVRLSNDFHCLICLMVFLLTS